MNTWNNKKKKADKNKRKMIKKARRNVKKNNDKRLWCVKTKMACDYNAWIRADAAVLYKDGSLYFEADGKTDVMCFPTGKWSCLIECDPKTREPLYVDCWKGLDLETHCCDKG
ncbi:hypothetical protein C9J48_06320 [Photobacterium profundum]|uniref:Uncharacterized protein n=1 Tax=Photobacterium profundum 3TCK TaxID=314280 RepID=Q1Z9S3_9GAMM|nr:hypothetical protein [Photobacterium profundum]EAS45769.1 hypothetical protein P3TCK_05311 [Photobacterium profundum 3TCK]PSV63099.1 hypothetical protein C9J48_06320 [Photobacterium profundum]